MSRRRNRPKDIWQRVQIGPPDACWPWRGSTAPAGYGRARLNGVLKQAHVHVYELHHGPVPVGLVVDHACHNIDASCIGGVHCRHRSCCNPAHLRVVERAVNVMDGKGICAEKARQTHCRAGHPLPDPDHRRKRRCKLCEARQYREWAAASRTHINAYVRNRRAQQKESA